MAWYGDEVGVGWMLVDDTDGEMKFAMESSIADGSMGTMVSGRRRALCCDTRR